MNAKKWRKKTKNEKRIYDPKTWSQMDEIICVISDDENDDVDYNKGEESKRNMENVYTSLKSWSPMDKSICPISDNETDDVDYDPPPLLSSHWLGVSIENYPLSSCF